LGGPSPVALAFRPSANSRDLPLEDFRSCQQALAARFDGDPKVTDRPRVMRLPGFIHHKDKPFRSRIVSISKMPPKKPACRDGPNSDIHPDHERPTICRQLGERPA
jgi:hypothetical protein